MNSDRSVAAKPIVVPHHEATTPRERILIVGSSGHARVVIDLAEKAGGYQIVGLIDRFRAVGEHVLDYEILGGDDDIPRLVDALSISGCVVAIGDNHTRGLVAQRILRLAPATRFVTLIHPAAAVARDVLIGRGSVLMAGVVVNPSARIGDFCILNTCCSVDHECSVGDLASLAPGVRLGGLVEVGSHAAIGIGAAVAHGVSIGQQTVIGAGAAVLHSVGDYRVAYGVPARTIRSRVAGETYM